MPKPKLSIQQQIDYMKFKGITFNQYSEQFVKDFLSNHSYFFKLKAYSKCFSKYIDPKHERYGQYISLDFTQLLLLSEIDMTFRQVLLQMTLEIEHAIKVYLNRHISEDSLEDGYQIVNEFLDINPNITKRIDNISSNGNSSPYTFDLISKYKDDFASWNLVEILTLKELILFLEFYENRKNFTEKIFKLLRYVRFLRNASAHINCLLNQFGKSSYRVKPSKIIKNLIRQYIPEISNNRVKRLMSVPVLHDFSACIFVFIFMVQSENAFNRTYKSLQEVSRLINNSKLSFAKETGIISGFEYIQELIKYFNKENWNNMHKIFC